MSLSIYLRERGGEAGHPWINQAALIHCVVDRKSASNVRVPSGAAAKVELHSAGQSAIGCDRSGTARDARCFTATISERVALTTTPDVI